MSDGMIAAASIGIAGAMLLVRAGWGGRRGAAAAGWSLAAVALLALTWRDGAWGLAIGTVVAMIAALAILLWAVWRSPASAKRAPRVAEAVTVPQRLPDLARRGAVFALTVPAAFAAAQWLAFGTQALARRQGAAEADAIVLALFLQPIAWAIIMTVQMTRAGPARMITAPVAAATLGSVLWGMA
jgi:hypothetical protein